MKLNNTDLQQLAALEGVSVPTFDRNQVKVQTEKTPRWLHLGAGNLFRGFIARINQTLLNEGLADTGIIAVDTFDDEIIDKIYTPYDHLTMLVRLRANGAIEKEVIAGVSHAYKGTPESEEFGKVVEAFEQPSLQMVSFTITEKGYSLCNPTGSYLPVVEADIATGPQAPKHTMSIVAALLLKRFEKGAYPIALCSMDNCSHNGEKLQQAVLGVAEGWLAKGFVEQGFIDYLSDANKVAFPWSMIDKITPRPDTTIEEHLTQLGIEEMAPVVTSKHTFIAPFVNAEAPEYLVIEDTFPNGRPQLEQAGVYLTTREVVNQVETMKVTTCLNPLHTALAVYGPVLGYTRIFKEMQDTELCRLVEKIGYEEGMPVVVNPGIINPQHFIDEVICERLTNPFIPDDPQRIATDTSQKVGIRFGETIKAYAKREDLEVTSLTYIPLAIAGWFRYLLGVDDHGQPMAISSDPLKEELTKQLETVKLGGGYNGELMPILANTSIFGVDLVAVGLAEKIENMFVQLMRREGAVRETLKTYLD